MVKLLDLQAITAMHGDEYKKAVDRVIDSGWFLQGKENNQFEADYAKYIGTDHCIAVANGLDALYLLMRGYKEMGFMRDGDEIIVPANTYIATIISITRNNLVPVLVEPTWDNLEIDIDKIESAVTPKTKGVMIVHLYGRVAYNEKLGNICKKHGLKLMEDCAQSHGCAWNGVKTGATNTNPTSYTVEDLPINLVAATHDQWRFDGWTDDNAGNADITTIPAGTTGNQSFTAHWTARYAVTWYVESTPTIEYYDPGATLTFPSPDPSAPTSCSEKQFVGWMVGTIEGETDDKPTFVTAGEVNADAAYHAVWANAAGSAIAAIEDNTFTQSDVSRATYCGISNGLQSVGKYVQNQSIWNSTQMTGVNVKIKVYHVSNSTADVLRISLINSSGAEVVGTDLTTSKLGNGSSSAGYSSNVTLTPTTAVTGYKVSLKTKNSSGTAVGKVTREVVPAYSKYSTSCCDNNVAAPNVTATATRNSITLSWDNVTGATGYKVTINGGTYDVSTSSRTYTASGLTSGTDYAWVVIATYNPANYCGALPRKSTTATLSVYGVTYNKNTTIGSGTVTMSPMPTDASTYIVGESVTAAAKPATCTNSGYTFNGWNTEPDGTGDHVAAGGTIAMVEGGLTLYAEWVAKRAYYVDRMHGQGDQTIEIGGKTYHCYYGDGYHTTPSPSDQKSGDACQTPHYRFVRWLTIDHINNDGTQKNTGGAVGGGVQRGTAIDGETYYAIWEEEIVEP